MKSDNDIIIKLEDVSYTYPSVEKPTVKGINLEVKRGEFIGLVGPTGSGKTTLLSLIAGVLPHYVGGTLQGQVTVLGRPTSEMSMAQLAKEVGLVMQDPEAQLFNLYVRDEVIWGLENLGIPRQKIAEERDTVSQFFRVKHLLDRITYDLSGGEKQLVAISSTYIMRPQIFIFDNPTSQLDPLGSKMVFEAIDHLSKEQDTTVIVNEDKVEELAAFADRMWLINEGQITIDAEPREFFTHKALLAEAMIRTPPVTAVGFELRSLGIDIEKLPLNVEEATTAYRKLVQ